MIVLPRQEDLDPSQYPGITVVSRDRSDLYANGITQGAPRAVQVVDRFHLVANLREALEAVFLAHREALKKAAAATAQKMIERVAAAPVTEMYRGRRRRPQHGKQQQERERQQRHAARVAMYDTIYRLCEDGATVAAIARRLQISRTTVYRQLQRGTPPQPKTCTRRSSDRVLAPYIPYLIAGAGGTSAGSSSFGRFRLRAIPIPRQP